MDTASHENFSSSVQTSQRCQIDGKSYSSHKSHVGNSLVEFSAHGMSHFGQIMFHFRATGISSTFIVIRPYTPLSSADSSKNFYRNYPHLHATMVYEKTDEPVVVDMKDLVGHIVVHHRRAGSFGICEPTCSVVSLRNIYIE
jgi:hypothetical protein